jgi:type II secretory pathway pseudopilin PulG
MFVCELVMKKGELATKRRSDEATQGNARTPSSLRRSVASSLISTHSPSSLRRSVAPSLMPLLSPRPAFSFAEVMFAVIVLGIGFIMIAAVFPVAISQSQSTKQETTTAAVVQQGVQLIQQAGQWDAAAWTWWDGSGYRNYPSQGGYNPANQRSWAAVALPHTRYLFVNRGLLPVANEYPFLNPPTPTYDPVTDPSGYARFQLRGEMKPISSQERTNPFVERVWQLIRSSRINQSDPRFAWVAFYRRDVTLYMGASGATTAYWKEVPSNFAQLVVLGVQSQGEGHAVFNGDTSGSIESDVNQGYNTGYAYGNYPVDNKFTNLDPRPIRVEIRKNANDVTGHLFVSALQNGDRYFDNATDAAQYVKAVAPGAYIVITNDMINSPVISGFVPSNGRMNGRIYRVGAYVNTVSGVDEYELSPDGDFEPDPGEDGILGTPGNTAAIADDVLAIGNTSTVSNTAGTSNVRCATPAIGFVMGKPMQKRSDVAQGFNGGLMDISVYSTFIQAK